MSFPHKFKLGKGYNSSFLQSLSRFPIPNHFPRGGDGAGNGDGDEENPPLLKPLDTDGAGAEGFGHGDDEVGVKEAVGTPP